MGFGLGRAHNASKLGILPTYAMFSDSRSLRYRRAWTCHAKPDTCCAFNMSAQDFNENFSPQSVKEVNKIVSQVKESEMQELHYVKPDDDKEYFAGRILRFT